MNDAVREVWVLNDEGLYDMKKLSGKPMREFIRDNRREIDVAIATITAGRRPPDYLKYG